MYEAMDEDFDFELTIDLNVLEHLGIGLYSNAPAVVSELVANAYDADSEMVRITLEPNQVVIEDDGRGMTPQEINEKYLKVGYDKRSFEKITPKYGRQPMGRKGIGKLSCFALASVVEVYTAKRIESGEVIKSGFRMVMDDIKAKSKKGETYNPPSIDTSSFTSDYGTRIILTQFHRTRRSIDAIKRGLARRFSILGKSHNFQVFVNGDEVTVEDRDYWANLQFAWTFGDVPEVKEKMNAASVSEIRKISDEVVVRDDDGYETTERVVGWIGTVRLPSQLRGDDLSNNGIALLARGKVIHENLLPHIQESRFFQEYMVGEIRADWLDVDEKPDIATSDRQSVREEDPRFGALCAFVKERFGEIDRDWNRWREATGFAEATKRHPILSDWTDKWPRKEDKARARKLIATVEAMKIADDEGRLRMFKNAIMAFETLALRDNVVALDQMVSPVWEDVCEIFESISHLEAAHYYEAVKTRVTVIQTLQRLVDENERERTVQELLYENLWLLNPAWERATEDERMEGRFVTKLEAAKLNIDEDIAGSRHDIKLRAVSGKVLVIELKKGQRAVKTSELTTQVSTYSRILHTMQKEDQALAAAGYEICVVAKIPADFTEQDSNAWKSYNARLMTYENLLGSAQQNYAEFLERHAKFDEIQKIVDQLGTSTENIS